MNREMMEALTAATRDQRETRMIECPNCGGEGGHETITGYNPRNGETTGYWTTCQVCEGKREIEIEVEGITVEDLDAMDRSLTSGDRAMSAADGAKP